MKSVWERRGVAKVDQIDVVAISNLREKGVRVSQFHSWPLVRKGTVQPLLRRILCEYELERVEVSWAKSDC